MRFDFGAKWISRDLCADGSNLSWINLSKSMKFGNLSIQTVMKLGKTGADEKIYLVNENCIRGKTMDSGKFLSNINIKNGQQNTSYNDQIFI